jgi:conjugal transfer pilus assembly protein TraF
MALQQKWTTQSALFSKIWQHSLLEHPELAFMQPTTQYGIQVRKEVDSQNKKELIQSLSRTHTLLFFYEGKNKFSQIFSKIVLEFAKQNSWTIQAVTVDGAILNTLPHSIPDKTLASEMQVNFFPALFAMNTSTLKAIPLSFGMTTISQIEDNILMQFAETDP